MASASWLPYGRQVVEDDDIEAVTAVMRSDFLTAGPVTAALEKEFASLVGVEHAVACSNGSTGLYLALRGLGIGEGDTVIVPTMTYVATANAARMTGASVVFSDVDPRSGLMTSALVSEAAERAGDRIRAVLPVHYAGQVEDLSSIEAAAGKFDAAVIEDACHAIGTDAGNHMVGSCHYSDAAVFSLHPVKTIAAGEGGLVVTKDQEIARRMRMLRENGVVRAEEHFTRSFNEETVIDSSAPWYHEFQDVSLNFRISEIHAALALSQLQKLDRFAAERKRLVSSYRMRLADLAPHVVPISTTDWGDPCWHLMVVLIDFESMGVSRAETVNRLREHGIGTQVHYIPVHTQPSYYVDGVRLPGAEEFYGKCLSLPLFYGLTEENVDYVVDRLKHALTS